MSYDPPAGLVQGLPVQVCVVVLQVVSTEITAANHVSEFKCSIEFNEPMTTRLEMEEKPSVRDSQ